MEYPNKSSGQIEPFLTLGSQIINYQLFKSKNIFFYPKVFSQKRAKLLKTMPQNYLCSP